MIISKGKRLLVKRLLERKAALDGADKVPCTRMKLRPPAATPPAVLSTELLQESTGTWNLSAHLAQGDGNRFTEPVLKPRFTVSALSSLAGLQRELLSPSTAQAVDCVQHVGNTARSFSFKLR